MRAGLLATLVALWVTLTAIVALQLSRCPDACFNLSLGEAVASLVPAVVALHLYDRWFRVPQARP